MAVLLFGDWIPLSEFSHAIILENRQFRRNRTHTKILTFSDNANAC